MKVNLSWLITTILRIYIVVSLILAAVMSPLAFSIIPVLVLAWYLFLLRWPFSRRAVLMTYIFIYFAIGLLYTPVVGNYLPVLISLPVIYGIQRELVNTYETITYLDTAQVDTRRLTSIGISFLISIAAVLLVFSLINTVSLLLGDAVLLLYFSVLSFISLREMPLRSVEPVRIQHQMIAGTTEDIQIELESRTNIDGLVILKSPYDWLRVNPEYFLVKDKRLIIELTLTPELSGPSDIRLSVQAVDRWGLFRRTFEIVPLRLFVIPRAKYAAWLADKYLAGTAQGSLPLISHMESKKPVYGLRRGVEYYGGQIYQPGDSLKTIDWKHSIKYNELITKEYAEFHGESAIILINLSVGDEKEADILAYNIIVTAVSLAQESIPAALAVYNHDDVQLVTSTLHDRQLVARCLHIAREMITYDNPVRYLAAPDVRRLRANMNRVRSSDSKAVQVLSELLRIEYNNLKENAMNNPATKALTQVLARAERQSNIVVISHRNHDAEALEFNLYGNIVRGNAVINI